ncbi:50S ribosomal protein L30 [Bombilactobacillus mellifer]|uniref:Large ribosomal subunit protein uL30 n=1 Tax=Bombilactobacillus mellifer TaxID=1218492 RepID=V5T7C7_9LACO|nr:50S ribosomal protein L30 [Bombilactobacillus mellifer]MBH9991565.1 50S ribosomal protein L30 [Lactobacillus sp. W8092]AHB59795.1 50S ribosomal protein L30 [Bombilactobacillus mellifer]KJY62858.1 50S ribosomal protein L30 [Bombilactobacillus mellifer]MCT6826631.1 50S ribosomal protein L30 [Bombilactobacillus mellifer]MCT6844388.1 50S ribosomal protein L30 [Bombilactobacillus mellifer]
MANQLKITLKRSVAHRIPEQRKVAKELGLGRINSSVVKPDNAAIRGAVLKIAHLVDVQEV